MADGTAAETLFSWIHLADLHVGRGDGPHRALILDALRRDIAAFRAYGLPEPDAIIITGDVAFSGNADEYATAHRWLREVAGAVGLGPDRVFVVPGNHDVDRTADRDKSTVRLVQSLRAGSEALDNILSDSKDRRLLAARLDPYLAFSQGFAPACLGARSDGEDELFWAHRFDARGGLRVRLLGLNTALLSADDADQGKLRLGTEQIDRGLRDPSIEPGELVIALSHHPFHGGWLADEKEAGAWIRNHAHVHLHGQVQETEAEAARSGAGSEIVRVAVGGRAASYGYSFAAVIAAEQRPVLRIWHRAWSDKNKRFLVDPHNAPDGRSFAEFGLRVKLRSSAEEPAVPRASLPSSALFEGPGGMPALRVPHFVGRAAELSALRRALAQDTEAVCVVASGIGGIGKTTLVREFVATEAEELFPEGAAWIDANALSGELGRVAQRFGWKRERLPTVEEANQWLAKELYGRAVLLVVDNAEEVQAKEIPVPGGRCRTLITSRAIELHEDLGKPALPLPLGRWSNEDCRRYLREISERGDLQDEALDGLAHFVGNLPLAIRLIAKLLKRGGTPERLLAQLEEEPLDTLDSVARGADRGVAATFLAAYRGLDETERRVLLAMSACARATRVEVVAKVAGVSERAAERVLFELWEQRSLVEYDAKAERPWGLHDVVRMFVRAQEGAGEAAERHVEFVMAHLEAHEDPTDWEAAEREMPEVIEAIERAVQRRQSNQAGHILIETIALMDRRGYYIDWERQLLALSKILTPDSRDLAIVLGSLGIMERTLDKLDQALEHHKSALKIQEKAGSNRDVVRALNMLSRTHLRRGDLAAAAPYVRQAIDRAEVLDVLHDFDKHLLADSLDMLGLYHIKCREYGGAIAAWQCAYQMYCELGDLRLQAYQIGQLGVCYGEVGEWQKALECSEAALVVDEQIGHLAEQLRQLKNVGLNYCALGQPGIAIDRFEGALVVARRLALPPSHSDVQQICLFIDMIKSMSKPMVQSPSAFGIRKIAVSNIRAIASLEWAVMRGPAARWNVILGDNGSGKSTLLRTIGLALIGHEEAAALRQGWGTWVRGDAAEGRAEVTLTRPAITPIPVEGNGAAADVSLHLRLRFSRSALTDEAPGDRELWNSATGTFTAAYGPFRRFTDGDLEYERLLGNQPRLARHLSLFDSRVALTESLAWLHDLNYKRLDNKPEGKLLEPFKALANDPGPPFFLPHGARLADISSSGITIKDGNGFDIPIEDLSDGYRAILSLAFDLIRHMANAFGYDKLFDPSDPTVVLPGGIVLIDEIDVHLHPTWQRTVGLWFKKHFPNVQFIVTTHSPLVCQCADSVFYLPAPGSDEEPRMLDEDELNRIRYGNVLDAYGTGVFGRGVTRSEESKKMRQRLAALNRKEAETGLTPEEQEEQGRLRAMMPSAAPSLGADPREGGA